MGGLGFGGVVWEGSSGVEGEICVHIERIRTVQQKLTAL